jgi:hypothetical protein
VNDPCARAQQGMKTDASQTDFCEGERRCLLRIDNLKSVFSKDCPRIKGRLWLDKDLTVTGKANWPQMNTDKYRSVK